MNKRVDISSAKMYMYKCSFIHDSDQKWLFDALTVLYQEAVMLNINHNRMQLITSD
jgi:hypothetical protein